MFVWNAARNTLLLPANLYVNAPTEQYKRIDFYNGLLSVSISPENGIVKNTQTTHIDTYVPNYCLENSPIGEYLANRSWEFNSSFIKR